MRISVKVSPRAAKQEINRVGNREFRVKVKSPPEKGEANKEVVEVIAEYFDVPKSKVSILKGHTKRKKIIEIKNSQ